MRDCRDITILISKGLDKESNLTERFAVGLHVLLCSHCRNFQTQSKFISKVAHRYTEYLEDRLGKDRNET